jgi:acetyl/propionyl-CoA carboxylase alpha subunit/acetyl-CoA carboxylase carboxyltransferase component
VVLPAEDKIAPAARHGEFQRLAIVNRGEPALRLITAVRELNLEQGRAIKTVALYTEADRRAMYVREADEAVSIGPATYLDPRDGQRKSSYLDYPRLERALTETRADAVWVGWGFVAEHADFVDLCDRLGLIFVGPSGDVMRRLGDKITSKKLAEEAGVPVAPWSGGPVEDLARAREHAGRMGYPLMIKATAGGGGRGIRKVTRAEDLEEAFASAGSEGLKSFGDATVFLERLVTGARHVEVQMIADHHGTAWALGVRDCSIQRRNQKVVEETPSPALTEEQDLELRQAAVRLARAVGYQNAGTVEFLYDPDSRSFSFMEVNARLQVEHPVTEMVTGADLVKLQLKVALGDRLEGEPPAPRGHSIEVRLNAEDPDNGFAPAPGKVERFRLPAGPGLRVDTGFEEGDEIAPEFDSMIAKIIAHGRDRQEALGRLGRALFETAVLIRGGTSNKGFLLDLLRRPEVVSGDVHVGWLDELMARGTPAGRRHVAVALLQAALEAFELEDQVERVQFFAAAARGRPSVGGEVDRTVELGYGGNTYELKVRKLGLQTYRVEVDGVQLQLELEQVGRSERRLKCGGQRYRVLSSRHGVTHLVEVNGESHRVSRDRAGVVRAPSPAVVVSVAVQEGDEVQVGDRLCVVEAMKTEMEITASFPGKVREVMVVNNVQVGPGDPLLLVEPPEDGRTHADVDRVTFDHLQPREEGDGSMLTELRSLVLGFGADASRLERVLAEQGALWPGAEPDLPRLLQAEQSVLEIFVDICSLFRRQPAAYSGDNLVDRPSTEEYFFTYLRDPGRQGEGLPQAFIARLRQAVAHYGLESLDRTPELEECLYRIFKAYHRLALMRGPIMAILQRRLEHLDQLRDRADSGFERLLMRLVAETRGRFPAINDLVREVQYRFFHQPVLEQVRQQSYADAQAHLTHVSAAPQAPDREHYIKAMVACPQPLKTFLSRQLPGANTAMREVMLEVLTRRYYSIRDLERIRFEDQGGTRLLRAEYTHEGVRIHLACAHITYDQIPDVTRSLKPVAEGIEEGQDLVVELYVWRDQAVAVQDETSRELGEALDRSGLWGAVRRVVVAISSPDSATDTGTGQMFTFHSGPTGFAEERLYRAVHPMIAKRLALWRLSNFDIERLPSQEGVYLFRGVAHDNPKDERLFAHAEVRDLTPVRNEAGAVIGLPDLERTFLEAQATIRRFQARRPRRARLLWNRIHMFVRPPIELRPDETNRIVRKLAPATEGLGLERVLVHARFPDLKTGELRTMVVDVAKRAGTGVSVHFREPPKLPLEPLSEYAQKVVRLRQRGMTYPYELLSLLTPSRDDGVHADFPPGDFSEYDLDQDGELVPVERPPGRNRANIIAGVIRNYTTKFPEGMTRVVLLGDPSSNMGSLAEPECRRILGALELARKLQVPVEWFALSAGARISMKSGVENMDWIAAVLRELVNFTQDGGEVNLVITGVNVGAQPYWNAEATMLMHTRGVLIMTPESSMVLTGKRALDYSGGVSAEDNQGIGGYERIMGPNGQAQFFARNISEACQILMSYYEHTYRGPGERFPRRAETEDPADRDVCQSPHGAIDGTSFRTIGDVFSPESNPGRKRPFDIRRVMRATVDDDHKPLERWFGMRNAETAVVWEAHLGGYPVCLVGLESRPLPRVGPVPADGPEQWSAGTLFPMSSKKVARAINAASGNRPVVILANLSGFDGSPESMRDRQLEFGAEIGRAVVNFNGPMVFCVISRYHGGAFVVFSNRLNDNLEVAALEGTYASVIGGAPAAAVVFARDVQKRTKSDPRVRELAKQVAGASGAERIRLAARLDAVTREVESEKLGQVAEEFDAIHTVQRAKEVGAVHHIVPPSQMRPYLIGAVQRGMERELQRQGGQ